VLPHKPDQLIDTDTEHRYEARADGKTPLRFTAPQPHCGQQQGQVA
jgi:hypothetical protein